MKQGGNRALMVWSVVWMALVVLGLLMFLISHLPVMNPPQCPSHERTMPDGSRCIIGANFGSGLLWLFSIGLMVVAGLATMITPPAALLVRAMAARRAGRSPAALPRNGAGAPTLTPSTPDWAGRHPYGPPGVLDPAPDTNQLCLASMVTGIAAIGFLVLCALLSAPLGVVAVITGAFGLRELRGRTSEGRRQAVVGICCGAGSLLVPIVILLWLVLTG